MIPLFREYLIDGENDEASAWVVEIDSASAFTPNGCFLDE